MTNTDDERVPLWLAVLGFLLACGAGWLLWGMR